MIGNILGIIWVLILVGIAFLLIKKAGQNDIFYFQPGKQPDIPYITVKSGDAILNMIVDSGCGASIIDKEVLKNLEYTITEEKISLSALTSDSVEASIVVVPIIINDKKQVYQKFAPYEGDDMGNFRALYKVTIHGILGSDFMNATGAKIDYSKGAVIFP